MVLAAFRYCLGRQTYIVPDCTNWMVEYWEQFAPSIRGVIERDLEEAFVKDDETKMPVSKA